MDIVRNFAKEAVKQYIDEPVTNNTEKTSIEWGYVLIIIAGFIISDVLILSF